jgi:hypothetical protein
MQNAVGPFEQGVFAKSKRQKVLKSKRNRVRSYGLRRFPMFSKPASPPSAANRLRRRRIGPIIAASPIFVPVT